MRLIMTNGPSIRFPDQTGSQVLPVYIDSHLIVIVVLICSKRLCSRDLATASLPESDAPSSTIKQLPCLYAPFSMKQLPCSYVACCLQGTFMLCLLSLFCFSVSCNTHTHTCKPHPLPANWVSYACGTMFNLTLTTNFTSHLVRHKQYHAYSEHAHARKQDNMHDSTEPDRWRALCWCTSVHFIS